MCPAESRGLFCHAMVDAFCHLNASAPKRARNVCPYAGRLEKYQEGSSVRRVTPPSDSNDSMYAEPMEFGCGRLVAISPWIAKRLGALVAPKGMRLINRVRAGACH